MNKQEHILLMSNNIWMLGEGMFGPLFSIFTAEIGADIFQITWVYSIYLFITGVGIMAIGRLGDKFGHAKLMLVGYFFQIIGTASYIFVDSLGELIATQVILGIALALSSPTWSALFDQNSGEGDTDGTIWGLYKGESYMVTSISMIIGGYIASTFGFQILFMIMTGISIVSFFYTLQILRYQKVITQ